jgi:hypothetical protein
MSHYGHICADAPNLRALLTIPAETKDVVSRRHIGNMNLVDDAEIKCLISNLVGCARGSPREWGVTSPYPKTPSTLRWWIENGASAIWRIE